ncbi:c-type cytochrome domain-containing protein [Frigoriglobus tundricola]|uniref:High-affnity carbon uptake protein Hat/HatR n=1 Tax=Frigoriglobus tundricola TaxID=2774151 RepID=A0A6M5YLV4_9BACT|nr:c-type cytochrome domain-containing protein [Frigoriglobus tundricola]QJW95017.1 High-affnity carbon uptake protein Hat/HatR [Frigoriglobus tundricola]
MRRTFLTPLALLALMMLGSPARAGEGDPKALALQAQTVLKAHCYRCHGQEGSVEGALNYVTDLGKLVARKKVVPGDPKGSRLYRRVDEGTMPPPDEHPRPSAAEIAVLKKWIEAGAPGGERAARTTVTQNDVSAAVLADLETMDRRARRFQRYFTLTHLHNAGLSDEELQTYRNALAKLVNSLSWGSKITTPVPVDANRTVLRIDLRWFVWDATVWNRVLQEYPYGVLDDSVTARAVAVGTAAKQPLVRADWFVGTASRAPLYYDILQLPANLSELEKQIRVDAAENIRQERVTRVAFNGSGISRFNRVLERHDSAQGMYWRTYDFDEPPANLVDRINGGLVPDRRNVFAFPLGPAGLAENPFQHAGGEAIFALPNGLHAYYLTNAVNARLDKGPLAIVSDPKRPDRAVEAGVSCMSCHVTGILPKADQVLDHLAKNPRAFKPAEVEVIRALYPGKDAGLKLMEADAKKYAEAVAKTGAKVSRYEAVSTITQKYEADIDLLTAASEVGLSADAFRGRIGQSDALVKHVGSLRAGGTVSRQLWVQAFGDIVRELHLGGLYQSNLNGPTLRDNTGELDPLEARGDSANGWAFTPDGRRAVVASGDRSVRYYDVEGRRDIKRFVGHTASVWAVALSPDGKFAASGSMDGTARVWDVQSGLEVAKYTDHTSLVSAVAFVPGDGTNRGIVSGSFDGTVAFWKTADGQPAWRAEHLGLVTALAVDPRGGFVAVATENALLVLDLATGRERKRYGKFAAPLSAVAISPNGKWIAAGDDAGTVRVWLVGEDKARFTLTGHEGGVRSVAIKDGGRWVLTGGADRTLRLWDTSAAKQEVPIFRTHGAGVTGVAFLDNGTQTVSGDRDLVVLPWKIDTFLGAAPVVAPKVEPPKAPARIPHAEP